MTIRKIVIVLLLSFSMLAQDSEWKDAEGTTDHPLISRFKSSIIWRSESKDYDSFKFILNVDKQPFMAKVDKVQNEEGKHTKIFYKAKENSSSLEIIRSYEKELIKKGFKLLYFDEISADSSYNILSNIIEASALNKDLNFMSILGYGDVKKTRILTMKQERIDGNAYVSVISMEGVFNEGKLIKDQKGELKVDVVKSNVVRYMLDIVETCPLESGKVKITAESIENDIKVTSHSSVYGILFDTGKTEIKQESYDILSEISRVLSNNTELKLFIVGHTDNEGTYEYNLELSKKRAEAVVKELVYKYAIDNKRLISQGVGPICPVASNKIENGKAQNRRVELVEQ